MIPEVIAATVMRELSLGQREMMICLAGDKVIDLRGLFQQKREARSERPTG